MAQLSLCIYMCLCEPLPIRSVRVYHCCVELEVLAKGSLEPVLVLLMLSGAIDVFSQCLYLPGSFCHCDKVSGFFLAGERHYKQGGPPKITWWLNQYLEQTKEIC